MIRGTALTGALPGALAALGLSEVTGVVNINAAPLTDISTKIIAAQATLGASGGKIIIPAGIFYVQNIPLIDLIYYEGAGEVATQLKLPNGATQSMFVSAGDLLYGWGFKGLYFGGIYNQGVGTPAGGGTANPRSTLSCIDCTASTNVWIGVIDDCRFEYFNYAYRGALGSGTQASSFDWYVRFNNCVFQYNNWACTFSEHLQLDNCFFILNGITNGTNLTDGGAITGRFNDMTVRNCWFVSNYQGAIAAATFVISNTQFVGCLFANQYASDITLDSHSTVTGCSFWGRAASTTYAIVIRATAGGSVFGNTITGNKFNEGTASYTGACIRVNDGNFVVGFYMTTISSNEFFGTASTSGPCIDFSGMQNASSNVRAWSISNNVMYTNRTKFIQSGSATGAFNSELALGNNTFFITGDYTSGTPIALIEMYTTEGSVATGNVFFVSGSGNKANVFGGVIRQMVATGNTFRAINSATMNPIISGGDIAGLIAQNNKGYVTRNSGIAAFVAATTVVVTHGLANTPSIQDIVLTPQGACLTPPYVSTVTSTQFTINIAGATTASIGWVARCNT